MVCREVYTAHEEFLQGSIGLGLEADWPRGSRQRKVSHPKDLSNKVIDIYIYIRVIAVYNKRLYDLSDYIQTLNDNNGNPPYNYINDDLLSIFKQGRGGDITSDADQVFEEMNEHDRAAHKACLNNAFYMGGLDFRETARCTVQNVMLVVFSAIIGVTILVKCGWPPISLFFASFASFLFLSLVLLLVN